MPRGEKLVIARQGNCDIHVEQKISFVNEMKLNLIGLDQKVDLKKSFEFYCQILVRVIKKVAKWLEWQKQ